MADESDPAEPTEGSDPSSGAAGGRDSGLSAAASTAGGAAKTILRPLVASKLRIALLLLVGLVALAGAGFFLGVLGAPEVTGVQNSFGNVSQNETVVETNLTVRNPNPIGVSLGGVTVDYDVAMNDVLVSEGATEEPFSILGGQTETLDTTANIQNQRLDEWWVSHLDESVHGHQVSRFQIDFTAVVELPTGQTVTVPLDDLTYARWIGTDLFSEGGDVGAPPDGDPESDGGGVIGDGSGGSDGGSGVGGDGSGDSGETDDGSGGSDGTDDSGDGDDGIIDGDGTL